MIDDGRWSLEEVFPGSGIFQMQSAESGKTLLQRFAARESNREAAAMLLSTLDSIRTQGVARSFEKKTIKRLSGDIVEIRVPSTVIRALSFNEAANPKLVVLEIAKTHQGSGNMSRLINNAQKKAASARALLEKWKEAENGKGL